MYGVWTLWTLWLVLARDRSFVGKVIDWAGLGWAGLGWAGLGWAEVI